MRAKAALFGSGNGSQGADDPYSREETYPIVLMGEGKPRVVPALWGFIPAGRQPDEDSPRPVNARAETIAELPLFRMAVRRRRCVVPMDSFVEYRRSRGRKFPHCVRRTDRKRFWCAGIWEASVSLQGPVLSFAVVTVPANSLVARIHDRMPAILTPEQRSLWLEPKTELATALDQLMPYAGSDFEMFEVASPDSTEPLQAGFGDDLF